MFSPKITESDAFMEMPPSSQNLYFHLNMSADDDGFVGSPKRVMRMIGAKDDDLKILIAKRFVIVFKTGVCVIKHWRIHNYIRSDRKQDTLYVEELQQLALKDNQSYTECHTKCQTSGSTCDTLDKIRLDKIRLDKKENSDIEEKKEIKEENVIPPLKNNVFKYCLDRKNNVNVEKWYDFYSSKGWMVGKNKMRDWKACIRTWENKEGAVKSAEKRFI